MECIVMTARYDQALTINNSNGCLIKKQSWQQAPSSCGCAAYDYCLWKANMEVMLLVLQSH